MPRVGGRLAILVGRRVRLSCHCLTDAGTALTIRVNVDGVRQAVPHAIRWTTETGTERFAWGGETMKEA